MDDRIVIGEILKPQGIKGELKVKPLTDDADRFGELREVYIGGELKKVLAVRIAPDFVYIALSGIPDRNAAELYRGKMLEVDREDAVELEEGQYFIVDVVGCEVFDDSGVKIGEVADIRQAARDIYTVRTPDGRDVMFPLLKDLVIEMDVRGKRITLSGKRLKEVAVYED